MNLTKGTSLSMPHEFRTTRRVEFPDTDSAGVVHFSSFFRYMEEAEHAFYRSLGASGFRWEEDRVVGTPRVSASCEFFRPVRYGDVLEVRVVVREKTAKALGYEVIFSLRDEGEAVEVARGTMRVVRVVRPHGEREWKSVELPAVLREKIQVAPETEDESAAENP